MLLLMMSYGFASFSQDVIKNKLIVDTSFNTLNFSLLDSVVQNKRIVFTGENHLYSASNQIIKLNFIRYLYDKGYRYHALELGAGIGFLANDYVTTGNTESIKILNLAFPDNQNPITGFLEVIERFNRDKTYEEKIKILGADYTRYPIYSTRSLQMILEQYGENFKTLEIHEDLKVINSSIPYSDEIGFYTKNSDRDEDFDMQKGFRTYKSKLFELTIKKLVSDVYKDSTNLKSALNEKYDDFIHIVNELDETLNWYIGDGISIQSHVQRERHLAKNIFKIIEKDPNANISGQFGRCHIRDQETKERCYAFDFESLTERLSKDSTLNNNILTVPIYYTYTDQINNKQQKVKDLFPNNNIYLYDRNSNAISLPKASTENDLVIINTYPPNLIFNEILSGEINENVPNENIYKKNKSEDHFIVFHNLMDISNSINQDLGHHVLPTNHSLFGIAFRTVDNAWFQDFSISGIQPKTIYTDQNDYRYSHWHFQFGSGYNFIYRKRLSMYAAGNFFFSFAKIREYGSNNEVDFSLPVKNEIVNYKNQGIGLSGLLGINLKMNWFSIIIEGGYQEDLSTNIWKNRGNNIQNISTTPFSGMFLKTGLSFFMN